MEKKKESRKLLNVLWIVALIWALLVVLPNLIMASSTVYSQVDVGAENTWTLTIIPLSNTGGNGQLNVSISGTGWDATVTLQRQCKGQLTWNDVTEWTANTEEILTDTQKGNAYRLGVKTGDYVSGTVKCYLGRGTN